MFYVLPHTSYNEARQNHLQSKVKFLYHPSDTCASLKEKQPYT